MRSKTPFESAVMWGRYEESKNEALFGEIAVRRRRFFWKCGVLQATSVGNNTSLSGRRTSVLVSDCCLYASSLRGWLKVRAWTRPVVVDAGRRAHI